jgi:1-acyl-sn-glycerol-3-phosphate acyltransferase
MIFNEGDLSFLVRKHLHRHLKDFGLVLHLLLNPFYALVVDYISSNIARVGSIPVDLDGGRAAAVKMCEAYLRKGRAVIALQGRGRVDSRDANPYVKRFRHGASVMAYDLYQGQRLSVPVTPLAIFGTHIPFPIPGTVKVNVGEPMYVKDHMKDAAAETIEAFTNALENRVKSLFLDIIRT